jgi:hypothetical protein
LSTRLGECGRVLDGRFFHGGEFVVYVARAVAAGILGEGWEKRKKEKGRNEKKGNFFHVKQSFSKCKNPVLKTPAFVVHFLFLAKKQAASAKEAACSIGKIRNSKSEIA